MPMATKRQLRPLPSIRRRTFPAKRIIVLGPADLASLEPEINRETNMIHWITDRNIRANTPRFTSRGMPSAPVVHAVEEIMKRHKTSKVVVSASRRIDVVFVDENAIALVHFMPVTG